MSTEFTADQTSTAGTKDKLAQDVENVVGAADTLLRDAVAGAGSGVAAARTRLETNFAAAKSRLVAARGTVAERARCTATATREYVTENPWTALGAVAAAGIAIGIMVTRR